MSTTVEEIEKTETTTDKKDKLLLDSLEIKGYRCFEHLTIEKLGRVNLIVGKNNVGKTALLEALWIYASKGGVRFILDSLYSREEFPYIPDQFGKVIVTPFISEFRNISSLNPDFIKNTDLFSIEANGKLKLSEFIGKLLDEKNEKTPLGEKLIQINPNFPLVPQFILLSQFEDSQNPDKKEFFYFNLENSQNFHNIQNGSINANFTRFRRANNTEIVMLWEEIVKKNYENKVTNALRILDDQVENISFVGMPSGSQNLIPIVGVKNKKEKVALRSFGEGVTRLLEIALSLVGSENGLSLIDEIDSGLHYSVLPDVWKLIFKTAKDLNVQVFATTHSKDCIEAFTQAAIDDEESAGMLIRLENKNGAIKAVNFNEDELETIERRNIEVR